MKGWELLVKESWMVLVRLFVSMIVLPCFLLLFLSNGIVNVGKETTDAAWVAGKDFTNASAQVGQDTTEAAVGTGKKIMETGMELVGYHRKSKKQNQESQESRSVAFEDDCSQEAVKDAADIESKQDAELEDCRSTADQLVKYIFRERYYNNFMIFFIDSFLSYFILLEKKN